MKLSSAACAIALVTMTLGAGAIDRAKDVPQNHWARKDVDAVLERAVMVAPEGKFRGDARLTRTELILAMAAFGKSLDRGQWSAATGKPSKSLDTRGSTTSVSRPVTRYEAAAVIARLGRHAAAVIPKASDKRFGKSLVLPKAQAVTTVRSSDPSYASIQYLGQHRMIAPNSILAKPGNEPVTGKELAAAVVAVISGVIDQHTDEPELREDIGPPPGRREGKRDARA
jgi:hypothetical protein